MFVADGDPLKPSPWLSVWWRPRDTIERIVSTNPKHHVLVLAALVGIWTSIKAPGVGSLVREAMRETWFGKRPRPASVVD